MHNVLYGPEDPFEYPCQIGTRENNRAVWFVDEAAAARVRRISLLLAACGHPGVPWPRHGAVLQPYNSPDFRGRRDVFAGGAPRDSGRQRSALPFRKIAPLMAGSDITFVNLESPFSDQGPYYPGGLIFHAAPDMIARPFAGRVSTSRRPRTITPATAEPHGVALHDQLASRERYRSGGKRRECRHCA